MQMNHAAFARSPARRVSLKRGFARQAIAMAERTAPDMPGLFRMAAGLRPNAKAVARLALRLKGRPGVVCVSMARNGRSLSFTTRAAHEVEAQVEGKTMFREPSLVYLRATVGMTGSLLGLQLSAISFCAHALERLIERSAVDLGATFPRHVDAEAQAILRGWGRGARIEEAGDEYYPAVMARPLGRGHDEMALDLDWGLSNDTGRVPLFSVRTFLSEAEMRPTVWLRWKDDPSCQMI